MIRRAPGLGLELRAPVGPDPVLLGFLGLLFGSWSGLITGIALGLTVGHATRVLTGRTAFPLRSFRTWLGRYQRLVLAVSVLTAVTGVIIAGWGLGWLWALLSWLGAAVALRLPYLWGTLLTGLELRRLSSRLAAAGREPGDAVIDELIAYLTGSPSHMTLVTSHGASREQLKTLYRSLLRHRAGVWHERLWVPLLAFWHMDVLEYLLQAGERPGEEEARVVLRAVRSGDRPLATAPADLRDHEAASPGESSRRQTTPQLLLNPGVRAALDGLHRWRPGGIASAPESARAPNDPFAHEAVALAERIDDHHGASHPTAWLFSARARHGRGRLNGVEERYLEAASLARIALQAAGDREVVFADSRLAGQWQDWERVVEEEGERLLWTHANAQLAAAGLRLDDGDAEGAVLLCTSALEFIREVRSRYDLEGPFARECNDAVADLIETLAVARYDLAETGAADLAMAWAVRFRTRTDGTTGAGAVSARIGLSAMRLAASEFDAASEALAMPALALHLLERANRPLAGRLLAQRGAAHWEAGDRVSAEADLRRALGALDRDGASTVEQVIMTLLLAVVDFESGRSPAGLARVLDVADDLGVAISALNGDPSDSERATQTGDVAGLLHALASVIRDHAPKGEAGETAWARFYELLVLWRGVSSGSPPERFDVSSRIASGSVLIEFLRLRTRTFTAVRAAGESTIAPARYLAFVVASQGERSVEVIDLGPAEPIDQLVHSFRRAVAKREASVSTHGGKLRRLLYDPLPRVGEASAILIAPDSELGLLPFEVLPWDGPGDDDRHLIDRHRISYLSSGASLVRERARHDSRHAARPVVIAGPDDGLGALRPDPTEASLSKGRSGDRRAYERVAAMLDVEPLSGADATKARLEQTRAPVILHLATDSRFLAPDQDDGPDGLADGSELFTLARPMGDAFARCGLAMAGEDAPRLKRGPPDDLGAGIMAGRDIARLDLARTALVVLSDCASEVAQRRTGDAVLALRHAFELAGADTVIMSMWRPPRQHTETFMRVFYDRLLAGVARVNALRQAQNAVRETDPEVHAWGAFVCHGDTQALAADVLDRVRYGRALGMIDEAAAANETDVKKRVLEQAVAALRARTEEEPTDARALDLLGCQLQILAGYQKDPVERSQLMTESEDSLHRSIQADPRYARARWSRGLALGKRAEETSDTAARADLRQDAVESLRESVRLAPTRARAWADLGDALGKHADEERDRALAARLRHEAIHAHRKALAQDPSIEQSWNGLAYDLFRLASGQVDADERRQARIEGIEVTGKRLAQIPEDARTWRIRAILLLEHGIESAAEQFIAAAREADGRAAALGDDGYNHACFLVRSGRHAEALECLADCLAAGDVSADDVAKDSHWARLREHPRFLEIVRGSPAADDREQSLMRRVATDDA